MGEKSDASSRDTQGFGDNSNAVEILSKAEHTKSNPMIKTVGKKADLQRSTTKMQNHLMEPITEEDKAAE
jgi:hypothetical protein